MNPEEFAEALYRGEKFYDSISGKIITVLSGPDIMGNVGGITDEGELIRANAKNFSLAGEKKSGSLEDELARVLKKIMK